jgi:ligand-binding SRPBCC domain-containing protein
LSQVLTVSTISLRFESTLRAPAERVWEWITSIEGISTEMWPIFRMTTPRGVRTLGDVKVEPGTRMFRSYVFLFGFLPIDYSDLTLIELDPGSGFVELSPMGSMRSWRHERRITSSPTDPSAVVLVDQLTFEPRFARGFVRWLIRTAFAHRHEVLRARLGGV